MKPTASLQMAADLIRNAKRFLVTTHVLPDGDGLGSQMALVLSLRNMGKETFAINASPTPEKFALVDAKREIALFRPEMKLPEVDLILVVDTNDVRMLGPMEAPLRASGTRILFIDHHVADAAEARVNLIDERFGSTGELAYELIKAVGSPVDRDVAVAVYVAIVTDTNSFRYKRTLPQSHLAAAELLGHGVMPEDVYRTIYANDSIAKVRLLGHALEGLGTSKDGRVAWVRIPRAVREKYGATIEDTESFINQLTLIAGVEISALFREEDDGRIKVSLRGNNHTPVFEIAKKFGGGGHRFAAGMRVTASLDEVVKNVIAEAEALVIARTGR